MTVFVMLAVLLSTAFARVWYVHPDSTLHSIQAAVDSCAAYDTVLVGPGTYYEYVSWWVESIPGIHLVSQLGRDTTIVDGGGHTVVSFIGPKAQFSVSAAAVVSGFTIRNGATGIELPQFCSSSVSDNLITGNVTGISVYMGSATITDNIVTENRSAGIAGSDFFSGTIARNEISRNDGRGVYLTFSSRSGPSARPEPLTIDSCTISYNAPGGIECFMMTPAEVAVHHSDVCGNAHFGIYTRGDSVYAQNNWWGDSTGPFHPDSNPGGRGDSVSNGVVFRPWLLGPVGLEEEAAPRPALGPLRAQLVPTIVRGTILLPPQAAAVLVDISGRQVLNMKGGANDVSGLAPGVYFSRGASGVKREASSVTKIVLTK
jgi:hypothetical protein